MLFEEIKKKFVSTYNRNPLLVRSPGRIILIGEHTDYNQGFVIPAAIDKEIVCAMSPNYSDRCHVYSFDKKDSFKFLSTDLKKSEKIWPNYILGVVEQFQKRGLEIKVFDCVFGGDIPPGTGFSSSSALACAMAYSFNLLFEHRLSKMDIVKMSHAAENEFVGVKSGIMDPFASVYGKASQVFRLDCKTLAVEYVDFPLHDYRIVLCDSGVTREPTSSKYLARIKECEAGVALLKKHYPSVVSLRDVTMTQLEAHRHKFDGVTYKRCKYVVGEIARVVECYDMLKHGDLVGFGQNMYKTHDGLSTDYEVSCMELDFLKEKAMNSGMIVGAKLMGDAYAGYTINLVKIAMLDPFIKFMKEVYKSELGLELKTYNVKLENGTSKL